MSDRSDPEPRRDTKQDGKRSAHPLRDSDTESDISLPKPIKRKKTLRVVSDSESGCSSGSSIFPHKLPRKRKPCVMSDNNDGSDSDSPLVLRSGRRTAPRVMSDAEGSSESESSGEEECDGSEGGESDETGHSSSVESFQSGNVQHSSIESDWETDWESELEPEPEEEEDDIQRAVQESLSTARSVPPSSKKDQEKEETTPPVLATNTTTSGGYMSDSSDGQSEKCPICLLSFTTQEVGTPESCDHSFCAVCLQEWSKNMNTCPVDRQTFSLILVRRHFEGKVIRRIPIEIRQMRDDAEGAEEDPTFCEVCGRSDREDRLLLCDGCDLGYHMECLNPPLESVPVEEWFCQDCLLNNTQIAEEVDIQEGELMDLLDDADQAGILPPRPRMARLLPRTRQSERVRATIRSLQRAVTEPAMQPSTSSGIESLGTESTASVGSGQNRRTAITSTTTQRRRRKGIRRKSTKRRRKRRTTKTTKKRKPAKSVSKTTSGKCVDDTPPTKTKRRKRRKVKKRRKKVYRRRAPRVVLPLSVKGRLAEQLGMCPPKQPGLTLPVVRARPTSDIDMQRSRAGIPTLHLFGQRDQLDYFSGSDNEGEEERGNVSTVSRPRNSGVISTRLLANRKLLSASAVRSHTAINSSPACRRNNLVTNDNGDGLAQSPCDIIGSILNSQTIWHSKKAQVTISRDGRLEVKKDTTKKDPEPSNSARGSSKGDASSSLIHNDNRLSKMTDRSRPPVNIGDASGRITQAPMYPGRGGSSGSRPPSGGGGFHQFSGSRYSGSTSSNSPSYNYQGGRGYTNFASSSSFDAHSTRAGYANYLNSGQPMPFRGSPMRFRLSSRFPLRRPPGPPPGLPMKPSGPLMKSDECKADDGEKPHEEEEDEIDIYSDIELGGTSGGPSGGGSEPDEGDRSYEALPPPPEPSALLMGLGEQALSDEDPASDSELVIDDATSPHDQSESAPQIPESEKYDPAEPSYDSDEDVLLPSIQRVTSNEDIPLPSCPTQSTKSPHSSSMSQHIVNSSSNSNISYLHSPTYGDNSTFESEKKLSSVTTDGVVNQVVKEMLKERLNVGTTSRMNVDIGSALPRRRLSADVDEEENEDCPNFSIYSALSMDIARRTGEEQTEEQAEKRDVGDDGETTEAGKVNRSPYEDQMEEKVDLENKEDLESENELEVKDDDEKNAHEEKDEVLIHKASDDEGNINSSGLDERESEKLPESDTYSKDDSDNEQLSSKITDGNALCESINVKEGTEEDFSKLHISDVALDEQEHSEHHPNNITEGGEQCHSSQLPGTTDAEGEGKDKTQSLVEEIFGSDDNDSLIGGATSAVSAATIDNNLPVSTPLGLEGLDTETISETEEAINFDDDLSQDGNAFLTAEEDGEIPSLKRKKKKKSRKQSGSIGMDSGRLSADLEDDKDRTPSEAIDYEEGEIVDDRPKTHELKKDKKIMEKKDKLRHEKESHKSSDENFDISKPKSVIEDEKKKKKKKSNEKGRTSRERIILGSSENKDKGRDKSRRSEENISWKKPSKSTKGRNYRDSKAGKAEDGSKDKEGDKKVGSAKEIGGKKDKKKKEKRKDMERYDVRKIVSDKKRKRRDEFGRDLSRDRSYSRSRSRSHRRSRSRQRSRSLSRTKTNRSKVRSPLRSRVNRSRSRSRVRSRSRSRERSRSRSGNKSKRKSRERLRKSRSKERLRARDSRSHSRSRRSRTRSRSRSKNRQRVRSRSRSVVRSRERKERVRALKEAQRFRVRRSWSRTWTPSWSRSHSRSVSCSSYSRSRTPSVRHFNRSYTRSFSRSWSRERHERIPVLEKKTMSKTPKKLTVIVSNTKDDSERQRKKDKKRKENRKNKDSVVAGEKRKKRKEKSPAPSKEVFTSGDNILVSVNFNKSNKTSASKDGPSATLSVLPKDTGKRKRDDTFDPEREGGKKVRKEKVPKEKGSPRLKGTATTEKSAARSVGEKKSKKQGAKGNKSARMVAILKQKPVAIIDLDQSPFHEQTPSPTDLIVLSDSDDEGGNKDGQREEMLENVTSRRGIRPSGTSPQASSKVIHNVAVSISATRTPESQSPLMSALNSYLITSMGPKTPPEPQVKFSIAAKPQLRSINNPLREEDDDMLAEDAGLDDSDQRIEEELDRSLGDIVHKGPNTPPEPRGPSTPCSPPTSPDAYDPFDPTKSGTPSPAGPEASMDGPPSPTRTPTEEILQRSGGVGGAGVSGGRDSAMASDMEDMVNKTVEARSKSPTLQSGEEITEERSQSPDRTKSTSRGDSILTKSPNGIPESASVTSQLPSDDISQSADISETLDKSKSKSSLGMPPNVSSVVVSESNSKSPERKITVVITAQQSKIQGTPVKQQIFPVANMKQCPPTQQPVTSTPNHSTAPTPLFPTLTPANIASILCTPPANLSLSRTNLFNTPAPIAVPPLLQQHHHIANSPAVVPARMPPEKVPASGLPLRSIVQNGEQVQKQPQDTTTEVVDMDLDSPYSPGSSEGDDLFEPPADVSGKSNQQSFSSDRSRITQQNAKNSNKLLGLPAALPAHKSPIKPSQDKFDSIFGMSPLRVNKQGATIPGTGASARTTARQSKGHHKAAKGKGGKHGKGGRKEIAIKMDEDQLQILDDLPSSAVELQVKDKFLKKLNRQERVVEEVKLSLKPHYTKKHITKEEYKNILRRSVPKICHNKSGEINPIKISSLVEAYVKKYRYAKKKGSSSAGAGSGAAAAAVAPAKTKMAKPSMWS